MAKLTGTGVSGSDIFCTARVKSYPGGRCEALVCDKAIFGGSGWEARQGARVKESRAKEGGHDVARAVRRARAQVRDIALCTPFRWFVTLTLDPARVNRYDVREVPGTSTIGWTTRSGGRAWLTSWCRSGTRTGLSTSTASSTTRWRPGTAELSRCPARKPPGGPGAPASGPNGWRTGGNPSTTFPAGLGASRRP